MELEVNQVYCMDALELMARLEPQSVDAIITDLPYGTTACSWDTIIPFEPMWAAVKRILKPHGVFVTTASQPFTSALVMSNPKWFKYEWVWDKVASGSRSNLTFMPLKVHENIAVFSPSIPFYYPLMTHGRWRKKGGNNANPINGTGMESFHSFNDIYHPKSLVKFSNADHTSRYHPTQKPVALYEYLIKTYTQPGELVLDFCCGSGTTGLAARNTGRRYILNDKERPYVGIAIERLKTEFGSRKQKAGESLDDLPLSRREGE